MAFAGSSGSSAPGERDCIDDVLSAAVLHHEHAAIDDKHEEHHHRGQQKHEHDQYLSAFIRSPYLPFAHLFPPAARHKS
jgi:hypothetical protein